MDLIRSKNIDPTTLNEWVTDQLYKLNDAYNLATEALEKAHVQQKKYADKGKSDFEFNVGDLVYKKIPVIVGQKKFQPRYEGPYKVVNKLNNLTYQIASEMDPAERFHIHIEKLIPVTLRDASLVPKPTVKERRGEEILEDDLDLRLLDMPDSTSASPKDKAKEEMIVENSLPEEEGKTAEQILEEIYYAPDPEVQLL